MADATARQLQLMNLIDLGLAPVRRLMHGSTGETCFVCRKPILSRLGYPG